MYIFLINYNIARGKIFEDTLHQEDVWVTYTIEYYSAMKRNKIVPFAETWIELETVTQSEVSKKERNKYRPLLLICGI